MSTFPHHRVRLSTHAACIVAIWIVLLVSGCAQNAGWLTSDGCTGYSDPRESQYVLPYSVGESHEVVQGNCAPHESPWSHYDNARYSYDFAMPIGTRIVAARLGVVVFGAGRIHR